MSDKSTPSPPSSPPKATHPTVAQVKADDSKQARKRGREGSLEPSGSSPDNQAANTAESGSSNLSAAALPKKKNRTLSDERSAGVSPDRADKRTSIDEGSREKEIRQGVEELGVTEQEKLKMGGVPSTSTTSNGDAPAPATSTPADEDDSDEMRAHTPTPTDTPVESGLVPSTDPDDATVPDQSASMDDSKTTISTTATIDSNEDISISAVATPVGEHPPSISSASSAVGAEVPDLMDADAVLGAGLSAGLAGAEKGLKRKHVVGEPSALGRSESYLKESKKVKEDEPVASTSALPAAPPKPVAKGFSSFAASSSPFVSRSQPPSTTSSPFGSAPPSATTSPTIPSASTMAPPSSTAAPSASKPNVPSFSAFSSSSGASPFSTGSKLTTSPSPFAGANSFSSFASANPFKPSPAAGTSSGASFGDILSSSGAKDSSDAPSGEESATAEAGDGDEKEGGAESSASQLNSEDMRTGEEGEETRHQARCKLHVMEKGGAWKERGTGLCKLNINTETKVTRLVMRAEGVFRLILNVALFQGMSCERQDKWVRLIAFENGAVLHVALRFGTAKGAEDLFDATQRLIPKPPAKLNYAMKGGDDDADAESAKGWGV